ncbi:hypothetical protein JCM11251_007457 [Rhodosporidiobolus azoricus]
MSSLNPRAPSFRLDTGAPSTSSAALESLSPSPASSKSRTGRGPGDREVEQEGEEEEHHQHGQQRHPAIAPSAVASVAVPPVQHHGQDSSPSTSSLLPPPSSSDPHPPSRDAPSPSPLLPHHRLRTSTRSASPSPSLSTSTVSSRYSLLPLSTFKRLHLLLFFLTFVLLFLLPVIALVGFRRDVDWPSFGLGVASWLAGETLREVIFELFTFPPSEGSIALPPGTDTDAEGDSPSELDLEEQDRRRRSKRAASALALPTVIHSLAQEALRLGAVALAVNLLPPSISIATSPSLSPTTLLFRPPNPLPPLDPLFFSTLWLALGWAAVEILWGSRRLWKQLEAYEDVLGPSAAAVEEGAFGLEGGLGRGRGGRGGEGEEGVLRGVPRAEGIDWAAAENDGQPYLPQDAEREGPLIASTSESRNPSLLRPHTVEHQENEDDEDDDEVDEETLQAYLREMQRDELEAQLGVPLYEIPVGVVLVWRIDSILLSLLFTLLLSLPFRLTPPSLFTFPLLPTYTFVSLAHALLSLVWVAKVASWGVPAISYASLVALVMGVFGALAAWGVLV